MENCTDDLLDWRGLNRLTSVTDLSLICRLDRGNNPTEPGIRSGALEYTVVYWRSGVVYTGVVSVLINT